MAKQFKGTINLDIRDSAADWDALTADRAPERSGDAVSSRYVPRLESTGGTVAKVICDDAYADVERHVAAAMARD